MRPLVVLLLFLPVMMHSLLQIENEVGSVESLPPVEKIHNVKKDISRYSLLGSYTNPGSMYQSFTFHDNKTVTIRTEISAQNYVYFISQDQLIIRNDRGFFTFKIHSHSSFTGISAFVEGEKFEYIKAKSKMIRKKLAKWTPQEEKKLIRMIQAYEGWQHYRRGDSTKAIAAWEKGMKNGSLDCIYFIGMHFLRLSLKDQTYLKYAVDKLEYVGKKGYALGYYQLAETYHEKGEKHRALIFYQKACDGGYRAGCVNAMLMEEQEDY